MTEQRECEGHQEHRILDIFLTASNSKELEILETLKFGMSFQLPTSFLYNMEWTSVLHGYGRKS